MEDRERDNVSQNRKSTGDDDVNRSTSERKGRIESDSNADFGQNIGRSENWDSEPSRRGGSLGNSSGRSGSSGSVSESSDISDRNESGGSTSGSRH